MHLLCALQLFGDVRQVYAACKHRGFILVTYYDLRAAMAAKNALHGAVAPGQQAGAQPTLEVYYTVPKGDMASSQVGICHHTHTQFSKAGLLLLGSVCSR